MTTVSVNNSNTSSTHGIVFIDPTVADYQSLIDGVLPGNEVIVLDPNQDGVLAIAQALQGRSNITSVHIVSHGSPGCLYLGNTQLCLDNLHHYAPQLQTWFTLSTSSSLLLYGCNVAAGDAGEEFIEKLHRLTGAEVAASRQVIGDGYWSLEASSTGTNAPAPFHEAVLATWTGRLAPSINNLSNSSYTEQAPAIVLDKDISFSGGTDYRGGYLEFSLGSATSFDNLTLITDGSASTANGQISILGNTVYLGNGTNAAVVGSVDSTFNGQNGQKLRINFSNTFENGNFNLGSPGSTTITGWTAENRQVKFGIDTIAGLPTPIDTTIPQYASNADKNTPSTLGTLTTVLDSTQNDGFGNSVKLSSSGMTTAQGYDVVRGPYIYSNSTVSLSTGDKVSFEWQAQGGGDAYDVYGYIVDVNTGHIETILNETGSSGSASTTWATKTINVSQAGEYQFVFVAGTYDFSGGKYAGAQLYIDDVTVTQAVSPTGLDDSLLSTIAQRVQYNNTSDNPDTSKALTVSLKNKTGETASANATINITPVNDAPTLTGTQATLSAGTEDTVYTISQINLLKGFSDVEGDTLSVSNLTTSNGSLVNNNNGTWSFTPAADYNGVVNFSYNVTDAKGASTAATQSFTLAAVNDAATLTGTQATLSAGSEDTAYTISQTDLLAGFTDAEDDSLSVSNLTTSNGSLVKNNNGTWSFTPVADYNGTINLSYNVIDGKGGSTSATSSFSLAAANDAATLTGTQATLSAGTEDTVYTISQTDLLAGFSDVDGDSLSVSNLSASNGSLVNNNNGTWSFTPAANYNGAVNLSYNVTDGKGGSTSATQSFTLAAVKDAPTGNITDQTATAYSPINFQIPANAFIDPDGDLLTYSAKLANGDPLPSWLSFDAANGIFTGFPSSDEAGSHSIQVTVNDGHGGTFSDTFALNIALPQNTTTNPPINGTTTDNTLQGNAGNDNIDGGTGHDILYGNQGNDNLSGSDGNDILHGGSGMDVLNGGLGNDNLHGDDDADILMGGSGVDILRGGNGDDTLNGNADNDMLFGDTGNDLLFGSSGVDFLRGGDGNDILYGGVGNDTLYGEAGNDTLTGGSGNDFLWGGAGNDKFVLAASQGYDIIRDFTHGQDLLSIGTGLSFAQLKISQTGLDTSISIANTGEVLAKLTGLQASSMTPADFTV